jgi:predicted unusual protein kinase regulating ubiquinone biosynthesis (AarF/ABC1/UbiB family)
LDFKAGVFKSIARVGVWIYAALLFALPMLWDRLNGHDPEENGPRRLRETFERMGTTFIKIGQQLSMRLDLFSDAYTHELAKMLDDVPPFPATQAIKAIERATGRQLDEVFSAFDSNPIGSASVACVYQAILITGERVAVKVRRPGIGPLLAADMRALPWILKLVELVKFTPGFFKNFSDELRMMLMEELDFRREAQFADLYRRKMRKTKQLRFVHVPKVFFSFSNDEVLVTEFVSGLWLKDLLSALERHPDEMVARLEEMNCDRIILARRIQLIARFNNFENIFFHADLHPANIVVQPGNKLMLIDFGSCGSFNSRELNSWRRWFDAQSVDDVAGMVQAALAIIEPVPPIDRDLFGQELEVKFWNDLYAIKSKHSNWSERISSRLWYGFLELSRKHQIPMRLNTLRMIRASMLTDTIAIRLDPDQDPYREFRYYEKGAGKRAKKRVFKRVRRLAAPRSFIGLEHGIESVLKLVYQLQRTVESLSTIRVQDIITRLSYFFDLLIRHIVWICMTLVIGVSSVWLWRILRHGWGQASVTETVYFVIRSPWWWFAAASPYVIILSRLFRRTEERKPWDH